MTIFTLIRSAFIVQSWTPYYTEMLKKRQKTTWMAGVAESEM